jgi:hypothetical protein
MAVVGDAYIVVRAITTGFEKEVRNAAKNINLDGDGRRIGQNFSNGFSDGMGKNLIRSFSDFSSKALAARRSFQSLIRTGYTLGPALSVLVSSVGSLAGGFLSLVAAAGALIPSLTSLLGIFTSLGLAALVTASAFSGVSNAISAGLKKSSAGAKADASAKIAALRRIESAQENLVDADERLTEAQEDLNEALKDGREELQQLGFDAEDAAISEKKAAIELEKARETLARVQDLPPNSRARREAQLAFAEAELNYRKSKDRNKDLQQQQSDLVEKSKGVSDELLNVAKATFPDVQDEGLLRLISATDTAQDAFKSVQQAAKAKARAERDALRAQEEAKDAGSGAAGADAFADSLSGLSKEAQDFVKFIVNEFAPALKKLRDAAAAGLFPGLEDGLRRLKDELFPELEPLFKGLAEAVADAFNSIVDSIVDVENKLDLAKVFKTSEYVVRGFGKVFGNTYDSILSLLVGADSQTRRFVDFLEKKTGEFAKFLDTKQASGELDAFFKKYGDIAASIGGIFGNAVSGIVNVIKSAFTPGGGGYVIIDWLTEVTAGFEKFFEKPAGADWLRETTINATKALSSIGAFIKEILKAGADPNVGKFWDTLKQAAPSFGNILTGLNSAGPAFAEFLVTLTKFIEVTLSSGAIQTFFNTLNTALSVVVNILSDPAIKKLFDTGARILAFFSALGLIIAVVKFGFFVISGTILNVVGVFSKLSGAITLIKAGFGFLSVVTGVAVGPLVLIAAAIAAVVAVIVIAYNKSEIFREAVAKLIDAVGSALKGAFDTVKEALSELAPVFEGFGEIFKKIGDFIGKYIVPIFQFVLTNAIDIFAEAIALAIRIVKGLWEIITGNPIEGLKTIFGALGKFIVNGLKAIWNNAKEALSNIPIFNSIMNAAEKAFSWIARLWNNTFAKIKFTVPNWVPGLGGKGFAIPPIPGFAEGGVIQPQPGGAIVRVAEAGRPERIEPLDEQGLSRRDRAIVAQLAGRGGPSNIINVYPSAGMNETELAAMIDRTLAFRLRRGGA